MSDQPKWKNWLKDLWTELRYRLGFMSKEEVIKELLPEREQFLLEIPDMQAREELRDLFYSLDDIRRVTDIPTYLSTTRKVGQQMQMISAKYGADILGEDTAYKINYIGGIDSVGWRPSGARIFQGFINPFQVFSFYAENHWATKAAIDTIVMEVINDGFSYDHDNVSPERLAEVTEIDKVLGIEELRLGALRHYLTYGNALVLPHKNGLQNLAKLELLIMDRAYPVQDRIYENIVGWDYWVGYNAQLYTMDQLFHLAAPSLKQPDIGIPLLASLVTDIESDLAASSLNGTIFSTAGMVGAIIVMDDDPKATQGKDMERFGRRLQKEIQLQFTGIQGAHGLMVTNYVKAVHNMTKVGDMEASFGKWRETVAKSICTVLRVPPEKLSINRSAGLQYQAALVEDSINKSFDKAIAGYMYVIDKFINRIRAEAAGITDVKLKANGRFGSMTLNGARMGKACAETGPLMTLNEMREMFYGVPPLPPGDKRGNMLVDNSIGRDPKMLPPQFEGDIPGQYEEGVRESLTSTGKEDKPKPKKGKKKLDTKVMTG